MYLNTVFRYKVFKYCPSLAVVYLFYLAFILATAQLFIVYNGFPNRREYFTRPNLTNPKHLPPLN